MTTPNWAQLAAHHCGPHGVVHGLGRWMLRAANGDVHLYPRESQAVASAPFYNCKPIDLQPVNFDTIPDLEDADEARARRRAERHRA